VADKPDNDKPKSVFEHNLRAETIKGFKDRVTESGFGRRPDGWNIVQKGQKSPEPKVEETAEDESLSDFADYLDLFKE
jgi:hypothetical protein